MEYGYSNNYDKKGKNITIKTLLQTQNENILIILINTIDDKKLLQEWINSDKRANRLIYEIDVFRLLQYDIKIPYEITKDDKFPIFLFNTIINRSESLIDIRSYLFKFENDNYELYTKLALELNKYYRKIIESYNSEQDLFIDYIKYLNGNNYSEDNYLFSKEINDFLNNSDNKDEIISFLRKETSLKISEVIIDLLFKDNIYNVKLNIMEILRYTEDIKQKLINDDNLNFYKTILNIDSMNNSEKIILYNKLKNKNISAMLYDDIRVLKDFSYRSIKDSLTNIVGNEQLKNTILSDKYGIDIYELNGEKFYMLVKSMNPITEKTNILETNQKNYSIERGCYSLIGSDNIDVYNKQFVYGFVNGFIPENIISVFETDCFSRESDEPILNEDYGTTAVNRLMTPDQIVNGLDSNKKTRYSEIQIAGKINPDFIVTFDEINELAVSESKRLNIPIVVINTKKYENNKKRSNPFNNENLQYIDFSGSRESNLRRSR